MFTVLVVLPTPPLLLEIEIILMVTSHLTYRRGASFVNE
jgi:hypothetical protein